MGADGAGSEARRLVGLLRAEEGDRRELLARRVARLVAEACDGEEPAAAARACAALRDSVLGLCEDGTLAPSDARSLCSQIDAAAASVLERTSGARRALDALQRALTCTSVRDLPQLALEGAPSVDAAAVLLEENGALCLRAAAGTAPDPAVAAAGTIAARAALGRVAVDASDAEGVRAVLALPILSGGVLFGVMRFASREALHFGPDERRFLRAMATRAAALLVGMETETRLRQTLRTFESLIDACPLPIVSVDRRRRVQIWNRAAEEQFGWTHDEVMGKPSPLVARERGAPADEVDGVVEDGGIIRNREVSRPRKDGTLLDLALSAAPLRDAGGEVTGSIAILVDITERKRGELEAKRTARFREQFVGIVSHDLRNPLTAILNSAQLLQRYGDLPERQARVAARISSSAERMARMIDDLLDFARSRLGGGFPIQRRRMDLQQVCEQIVEELEFAWTRSIPVDAQGDLWGNWDPDRIAQVISNLVGNALQHSQGDVRVTLRAEGDTVVLETWNGGQPIPAEVVPHLFEPGRRDARSSGLGLGLFIVQQIVLAHGGHMEVRSDAEGTVFTVALPRRARHNL
ncbi:MAG TPA: ATP-binding protein [Myxococcales bacterium]|nr:ATP-binding protein [Myxococcales bacterium]